MKSTVALGLMLMLTAPSLAVAGVHGEKCSAIFTVSDLASAHASAEDRILDEISELRVAVDEASLKGDSAMARSLYSQYRKLFRQAVESGIDATRLQTRLDHSLAQRNSGADALRRQKAIDGEHRIVTPWQLTGRVKSDGFDLAAVVARADGSCYLVLDKTLVLKETASGEVLHEIKHSGVFFRLADLSADGRWIAAGTATGDVVIFDAASGRRVHDFATGFGIPPQSLSFSADGSRLLAFAANGRAKIWDTSSAAELESWETPGAPFSHAMLSADGSRVITTPRSQTSATIWDVASGKELRKLTSKGGEISVAVFSPDGRLAVTGGDDRVAQLWDVQTGQLLQEMSVEGRARLKSAAFSPDGASLVTFSDDAMIWDVASGRLITVVQRPNGSDAPSSFQFLGDESHLLSFSFKRGAISFWEQPK